MIFIVSGEENYREKNDGLGKTWSSVSFIAVCRPCCWRKSQKENRAAQSGEPQPTTRQRLHTDPAPKPFPFIPGRLLPSTASPRLFQVVLPWPPLPPRPPALARSSDEARAGDCTHGARARALFPLLIGHMRHPRTLPLPRLLPRPKLSRLCLSSFSERGRGQQSGGGWRRGSCLPSFGNRNTGQIYCKTLRRPLRKGLESENVA